WCRGTPQEPEAQGRASMPDLRARPAVRRGMWDQSRRGFRSQPGAESEEDVAEPDGELVARRPRPRPLASKAKRGEGERRSDAGDGATRGARSCLCLAKPKALPGAGSL